jgi:hypothetical protein
MNTQQEQSQKCIFKIVHMNKLTKNYNVRGLILTSKKKKKNREGQELADAKLGH